MWASPAQVGLYAPFSVFEERLLPHKDPVARKAYHGAYRARNREAANRRLREFRARHRERVRAEARERNKRDYHAKLKHDLAYMARNRAKVAAWERANPILAAAMHSERVVRRRLQCKQAMPRWANKFFIREIYDLAQRRTKALGISFEVDHIFPLQGKNVCGLHWEGNLRVVPAVVNRCKGASLTT